MTDNRDAEDFPVQSFKDHFSTQSNGYARYRPTYPKALFKFLASVAPDRANAWDCATGNGQAAVALSEYFSSVVASDASSAQVEKAALDGDVRYMVATAEQSGLPDESIDLITVAQAFHWFDQQAFFDEAARVLRSNGVLAIWCYTQCTIEPEIDALIDRLYRDIVGPYWPPERTIVESGYAKVALPGEAIAVPNFSMSLTWTVADMLGYLRTWSACERYIADKGRDPVTEIEEGLSRAWGGNARRVSWPLQVKVSCLIQ